MPDTVDSFIGEIALFPYGNLVPRDWLPCEGQILPIAGNDTLFAVIGAMYGGDGTNNFALPDLRGAAAMGAGQNPVLSPRDIGERIGEEGFRLTDGQVGHTHRVVNKGSLSPDTDKTSAPRSTSTFGSLTIKQPGQPSVAEFSYVKGGQARYAMNPATIGQTGGNARHENRQPFMGLRYCICTSGVFPAVN